MTRKIIYLDLKKSHIITVMSQPYFHKHLCVQCYKKIDQIQWQIKETETGLKPLILLWLVHERK